MSVIIGAICLGVATIIYILLILGFPLGEFSMGGKYKVLPKNYRIIGLISLGIQFVFIIILLQAGDVLPFVLSKKNTKGIGIVFSVYLTINVIMNALSNSKKEKYIVTPISLVTAICYWITVIGM